MEGNIEENSNKSLSNSQREEAFDAILSMEAATYGARSRHIKWSKKSFHWRRSYNSRRYPHRLKEIRNLNKKNLSHTKSLLNDLTEVNKEDRGRVNEVNTTI